MSREERAFMSRKSVIGFVIFDGQLSNALLNGDVYMPLRCACRRTMESPTVYSANVNAPHVSLGEAFVPVL